MILESKNIKFTSIDITEPTAEQEKDFMQANATEKGITVSDTDPRHPLPPQIFNGTEYCGDYNSFELANECDTLEQFLKLATPPAQNGSTNNVAPAPAAGETNGNNGDAAADATLADEDTAAVPEPTEATPSEPVDAPAEDAQAAAEPSEAAADSGEGDAGGDASAE